MTSPRARTTLDALTYQILRKVKRWGIRHCVPLVHAPTGCTLWVSDLIVIPSCCVSGIIGDDVETIACEAEKSVSCRVLAVRSEGFGSDFRSGYEDAFRVLMDLMEPPKRKQEKTINILRARMGPTRTEIDWDLKEIERLLDEVGIKISAEIAGGCTVEEIRRAREAKLNASLFKQMIYG